MSEATWRGMRTDDLPAVLEIAKAVHPSYPERPEVFAERLSLAPRFCLVLERSGSIAGYMLAHPWTSAAPPALDTLIERLPGSPDTVQLHDLAITPAVQGRGLAGPALERLDAIAGALVSRLDLVAVAGKEGFWARRGFVPVGPSRACAALASYGAGAVRMTKPLSR